MIKPERDDLSMPYSNLRYSSEHFLLGYLQCQPEAAHANYVDNLTRALRKARPCIFQPGNYFFTGWGSKGVNNTCVCTAQDEVPGTTGQWYCSPGYTASEAYLSCFGHGRVLRWTLDRRMVGTGEREGMGSGGVGVVSVSKSIGLACWRIFLLPLLRWIKKRKDEKKKKKKKTY